ncbi:MAG: hypothetical protein M3Y60_00350 [Bacteroidota bacterium]|nr:hypothetical protein [Bacteroidota bacterium]
MKDEILSNLNNPGQLERLYRQDRPNFRRTFNALYPDLKGQLVSGFWHERLNFAGEELSWGTNRELIFVVFASLLAGIIAKTPALFHIDEDFFYPRNIGFILFPMLTAYFAWKNKLSPGRIWFIAVAVLAALIFMNALPDIQKSDTLILSCIHVLPFLWCILGLAYVGDTQNNQEKRLNFLKYNGDLIVMTSLIVIAGGILTGLTLGLFSLIGLNIEEFWGEYVVIFGLPTAPILASYLIQANPHLVGKVSPVIARLFSPLVLVMLVVYLIAIVYTGKDPYNDREFLLVFNALLAGVMVIIFFSLAGAWNKEKSRAEIWVLFLLSEVTAIVNCVALSAILFRISEWGITPNRAAVLGGNVLMLINLIMVIVQLFGVVSRRKDISAVSRAITSYLPVYFIWAIIVTFIFPLIFGFA